MNHNELLDSLAIAKDSIYTNCPLGSAVLNNGVPVADLIVIRPSYTRFCVDIFEVKASRSDFQGDIRSGKWKKYLPYCHRLYFAVLDSVCTIDEIPDEAGLYIYNRENKSWYCKRQAKFREIIDNPEMLKSLIFYRNKSKNYKNHFYLYNEIPIRELEKAADKIGKSFSEFLAFHNRRNDKKIKEYGCLFLPKIREK